eukprot:scaffold1415_cov242-Pinguiococcus_pyrenoidosus.AAC.4
MESYLETRRMICRPEMVTPPQNSCTTDVAAPSLLDPMAAFAMLAARHRGLQRMGCCRHVGNVPVGLGP